LSRVESTRNGKSTNCTHTNETKSRKIVINVSHHVEDIITIWRETERDTRLWKTCRLG
jgi:hypothetical protein